VIVVEEKNVGKPEKSLGSQGFICCYFCGKEKGFKQSFLKMSFQNRLFSFPR
jgi:hypothetical protein